MAIQVLDPDPEYVLNHCTKYLARDNTDPRHNFGQFGSDDTKARIAESWRFPLIDTYSDGTSSKSNYAVNQVTFVYQNRDVVSPVSIGVIGTFATLYEPIPLRPIQFLGENTGYFALTVIVPKAEVHLYKYLVNNQYIIDPINPQRVTLDNNKTWSRFFTQFCTQPLSFEDWEYAILQRLVAHILPFRTREGQNFIDRYYNILDKQDKAALFPSAYRLDESVGAANYIDCILAREENHHLIDYKICISEINQVLRQRNPFIDPQDISVEMYAQLYDEMAANTVPGWDYSKYGRPRYFWELLRRHTFTGAFSHPKYGGNIGAAGWAYLAERYLDTATNTTLFNWQRAIESPLGINKDYHG
ncbi:gluconate 2-dehydrogenase subunit 3 family protein [Nitrosomonas communis]|uniref:Gluconate 2-dehydrogenase subunit 3 n=1 Tax=Nitrosomonas communis TaxID=44574 RepID=A0A1H2XCD6_9PROT|nr:gluconate 2-dehydrogenase subunit 3 family protein [Nitrosomonas communis]SDW90592.1 Gluconate 2-dehydrogenase subunit 3 [Nitrosomonas communis]